MPLLGIALFDYVVGTSLITIVFQWKLFLGQSDGYGDSWYQNIIVVVWRIKVIEYVKF